MKSICYGVSSLFCLTFCGCTTNEILLKQRQAEMEARLEQVVQQTASDSASIQQLAAELKQTREKVSANAAAVERLTVSSKETSARVDELVQKVETVSFPVVSPKIEVVNREASHENDSGQQEAYMKAFGLFSANNYDEAVKAFDDYLVKFPAGEYAGNAQYWIAECFYTKGDFNKALDAFNAVVSRHPGTNKAPDAMLKAGYTLISLQQSEKGNEMLRAVIDKYPGSQAAIKAQERLTRR